MATNPRVTFLLVILFSLYSSSQGLPLSTKKRWVIDDSTGRRVKLACGNVVGHLESLLPEGMSNQPLSEIAKHTKMMGFNCIRLTYAVYMFTRFNQLTVYENFDKLGLHNALEGISQHNPDILGLNLVEAQKAVVDAFAAEGIMIILDNQVSQPMWCCADNDGNGFFGDKYFDPDEWLESLTMVAKLYRDTPAVVGMSLRNEIRGPRQNESVWYENVHKASEAIHNANPNLLVIIGGLNYAIRLEFLKQRPLKLHFKHKIMYETHRYAFSEGQGHLFENLPALNDVCQSVTQEIEDKVGYLSRGPHGAPIFISEFGFNQVANETSGNTFMACFLSYLAEHDYEWALWALHGSYYYREGIQDLNEVYGMFSWHWDQVRNPSVNTMLQLIQRPLRDPFSNSPHYFVLFHPVSGKCMLVDNNGEIHLSDCFGMARFGRRGHHASGALELLGTGGCLTGVGEGLPVEITGDCKSKKSSWKVFNKYQLAYVDEHGDHLCLEWDPSYSLNIVTKKCIIFQQGFQPDNPQRQWFNLVRSSGQ